MRKLLPVLLGLLGLAAGGGAGFLLRPAPEEAVAMTPCGPAGDTGAAAPSEAGDPADHADHAGAAAEGTVEAVGPDGAPLHEYVKLNNQFVVPVVEGGEVAALVILSISLEVTTGTTEQVYAREPKLRDLFLQVLFDHANAGGFQGAFTQSNNMEILRNALMEVARKVLGDVVTDVLIVDIVRQDS